jgi:hypothetical protein
MRSSSSSLSVWDGDIIPRQINSIPPNLNINIPNALLYMKREAYADSTIKEVGRRLRRLQRNCNLHDPENVKTFIANKTCGNGYKQALIEAVPILGKHVLKLLYLAVLTKGEIEQRDIASILAAQIQDRFTPKQKREFITVLKKYPEPYQRFVNTINRIHKDLRELSDLL